MPKKRKKNRRRRRARRTTSNPTTNPRRRRRRAKNASNPRRRRRRNPVGFAAANPRRKRRKNPKKNGGGKTSGMKIALAGGLAAAAVTLGGAAVNAFVDNPTARQAIMAGGSLLSAFFVKDKVYATALATGFAVPPIATFGTPIVEKVIGSIKAKALPAGASPARMSGVEVPDFKRTLEGVTSGMGAVSTPGWPLRQQAANGY